LKTYYSIINILFFCKKNLILSHPIVKKKIEIKMSIIKQKSREV
jgi:hypothetical protein